MHVTKPLEPDIWHYTDWAGLNGILKSKQLWASHILYLNDSNEMSHAIKRFKEIITSRITKNSILDWKSDIEEHLLNAEDLGTFASLRSQRKGMT